MPSKAQERTAYTTPLPASPKVTAAMPTDDVPRMSADGRPSLSESKLKNELSSDTPAKEDDVAASDQFGDPLSASTTPISSRFTTASVKLPKTPKREEKSKETEAAADTTSSNIEPPISTLTSANESPNATPLKGSEAASAPAETIPSYGDKSPLTDEEKKEEGESQEQTQTQTKVDDEAEKGDESLRKSEQAVQDDLAATATPDSASAVSINDDSIPTAADEVGEVVSKVGVKAEVNAKATESTELEEALANSTHTETKEDAHTEREAVKEPVVPFDEGNNPQEEEKQEEPSSPTKSEVATIEEPPVISPSSESLLAAAAAGSTSNVAEVEGLQARLKQVEQRFAGMSRFESFIFYLISYVDSLVFRRFDVVQETASGEAGCGCCAS